MQSDIIIGNKNVGSKEMKNLDTPAERSKVRFQDVCDRGEGARERGREEVRLGRTRRC
jgi:hypothetical protein